MKMKVGITGTSRGLGKYLMSTLPIDGARRNIEVYPIATRIEHAAELVEELEKQNCNVFINNASSGFHQAEVFSHVYDLWRRDEDKYIINIGSRASNPNISKGYVYAANKNALVHLTNNFTYNDENKRCRVSTIDLGLIDGTHPIEGLHRNDVMVMIDYLLALPERLEIPHLTLHHRANYQEVQKRKAKLIGP